MWGWGVNTLGLHVASHRNPILINVCESFLSVDTDEEGHVCVRCFHASPYSSPTKPARSICVSYHWDQSSEWVCVCRLVCVGCACVVLHVLTWTLLLGHVHMWLWYGLTAVQSRRMHPEAWNLGATARGQLSHCNKCEAHQLAPVPMATLLVAAALLTLHQRGGKVSHLSLKAIQLYFAKAS